MTTLVRVPDSQLFELRPEGRDHLQLPETDGSIVDNYQEHPQSTLLTGAIWPVLRRLHPDNQFAVGLDSGIYYRDIEPPLAGCRAPDWYYVPGVPPMLDGTYRRSYVLWREGIIPTLLIEYASYDGTAELDTTPESGKFWVYERAIRAPYYVVFISQEARVEAFQLIDGRYRPIVPNERGHYRIEPLDLELGIWHGNFRNMPLPWLRWYDADGELLPSEEERAEQANRQAARDRTRARKASQQAASDRTRAEQEHARAQQELARAEQANQRAEQERQRAEQERQRAEQERQRAEVLAARLRALGLDPDQP